jgi:hypothetical protein
LLGLDVCTEEEQRRCLLEIGEGEEGIREQQWACLKCEKRKVGDINPYVFHLFELRRMILAGYPFKGNDLPMQTWIDLGILTEVADAVRRQGDLESAASLLFRGFHGG